MGIEVLVTDHHLPGEQLPDANVIVNPNLPGSTFGSRALAGVGVAFYVLAALQRAAAGRRALAAQARRPVAHWLDLVALGTVADLVPLDANNRVLVAQGLRAHPRRPVRAGHAARCWRSPSATRQRWWPADLGFAVGPRLNAAGRLDDMSIGIRCLLATTIAAGARAGRASWMR